MEYREEEYLQLSGIQHFVFCRRQWALAYLEQQWVENERTADGRIMHRNVHDSSFREKRGDLLIVRGMKVSSARLGLSGECDAVEFRRSPKGVPIFGQEGTYTVTPVEYKRGKPKEDECDIAQLTAQAMCLEEMFSTQIPEGALFYGETKRREIVEITEELRSEVREMFQEMHQYYERRYTPKVKMGKNCTSCSLKELCMPRLAKTGSVKNYMDQVLMEENV